MHPRWEQHKTGIKEIRLAHNEKQAIRRALVLHMEEGMSLNIVPTFSFFTYARTGVASLLVLVLAIGGVSFAAERALPGDILYPVKVGVTEQIWSLAAISYEAEAEWRVLRAVRRLEEAERLAKAGVLDEKRSAEIASRFEEQTEDAKETIVQLKRERINAAADTSTRLELTLELHERQLMQVAQDREDISSQVHVLLDTVRKRAKSISIIRQQIEEEILSGSSGEGIKEEEPKEAQSESEEKITPAEKAEEQEHTGETGTTTPSESE